MAEIWSRTSPANGGRDLLRPMHGVPSFVGRRDWLGWLREHLAAALAGEPRVALISGEPGVGKTRLMRELLTEASQRGASAFRGHCSQGFSPPYQPFQPLLAELERNPSAADADFGIDTALIRRAASHAESEPADSMPRGDVEQEKLRLFLAVTQVVLKMCRSRPVVFVIDGLHWADPPSLELFQELIFAASDAMLRSPLPLMVVAGHRPVDAGTQLARVLDRIEREEFTHRLELPGLQEGEVERLVRELALVRPSAQLVSTLCTATRGNPLFIQEALNQLARSGAIAERGGELVSTTAADDLELPLQLTESIKANIEVLGNEIRETFTVASLIGDRFSIEKLSAVTGKAQDDLLVPIEEGLRRGFVTEETDGFSFAHPVVRGVFRSIPSTRQRQLLRARIAAAFQLLYADELDAHVVEITEQLTGAGLHADPEKLLHFGLKAGDRAMAAFSPGDAARYYEAALAASQSIPAFSDVERARLYLRAGQAHFRNTDPGPCLEYADRAIDEFEALEDTPGVAEARDLQLRVKLILGETEYGEAPDTEPLERALEALGEDHVQLRGRIYASLAGAYFSGRQPERAEEAARCALDLSEQIDDAVILANAAFNLGLAQFQRMRMSEARETMQQAIRFGRRAGDLRAQAVGVQRLPLPLLCIGELDQADQVAEEAVQLVRATHDWSGLSHAAALRATVATARGDFGGAERHAEEALRMARRSRYFYSVLLVVPALACARALQGDWAGARAALGELSRGEPDFHTRPQAAALAQSFLTKFVDVWSESISGPPPPRVVATERAVRSEASEVSDRWEADAYSLTVFCALVEMAILSGDAEGAEQFSRSLREAWHRGVGFSTGWVFLVPRVLGEIDAMQGRWDAAEEKFSRARELAAESGALPELARVLLDNARMCMARDGAGDRERATELLLTAHDHFRKLDMRPFATQACALAERLGFQMADGASISRAEDDVVEPELSDASGRVPRFEERSFRVIFFTDMEESTSRLERLGDFSARRIMRLHDRVIRAAVREHGGSEIQHTGDGLMVSFSSASNAVYCADRIHRDFELHSAEHPRDAIRVRIGVHGGEPLIQEHRLFGVAVNAAARLCDHAEPGKTLASDVVRQLVAGQAFRFSDRGEETLKGFSMPFRVFEVDLTH